MDTTTIVTEVAAANQFLKLLEEMLTAQEDNTESTPTIGSMLKLTSKKAGID
jgi:hypothetical protein